MSLNQLKRNLRRRIATGETEQVIEWLSEYVLEDSIYLDEVYSQSARYNKNEKAHRMGNINLQDYKVETAAIETSLLAIINKITDKDVLTNLEKLRNDIRQLGLRGLPKVSLLNCNRRLSKGKFIKAFEQQSKSPAQFYFLLGCPTQKPDSFCERVIYEIIMEQLKNDEHAINFDREEVDVGTKRIDRVLISPLPFAEYGGLEDCKNSFNAYLEERLLRVLQQTQKDLPEITAENLATLPPGILLHRYFTFLFRIDLDVLVWEGKLLDYLHWIVNTFRQDRNIPPTFQFIFVISLTGAHLAPRPELDDLRKIVQPNPENASPEGIQNADPDYSSGAWIDLFPQVSRNDLVAWFRTLTKHQHIPLIDKIVDDFTNTLQTEGRWDGQSDLNMADVEELMQEVYITSHQ